jgi:macrodomain Ter protein organizer (MatP/YcbG family)
MESKRRSIIFSHRHNEMLERLSKELGVTLTETLQRALEALEEKEHRRKLEVSK